MPVTAKICGVNAPEAVAAAVAGGASHMGLNFYPPSPRYVAPALAAALAAEAPAEVCRVGLFVGQSDAFARVGANGRRSARRRLRHSYQFGVADHGSGCGSPYRCLDGAV